MAQLLFTQAHVDDFRRDGVVLIRGLFVDVVDTIRAGIDANLAARTGSTRVQLLHEHVLVEEPGTAKPTTRYQDGPYHFVAGRRAVSF